MDQSGVTRFENEECCVVISRLADDRVLVVLEGKDRGKLGSEPFHALESSFREDRPLELFFDLHAAAGATLDVSGSWAVWLRANRARLGRVRMLIGSPFVKLSALSVQRFSGLGSELDLYTDPTAFADELQSRSPNQSAS